MPPPNDVSLRQPLYRELGIAVTDITERSSNEFIREYDLENDLGSLYLIQKDVGDVNCVVWDAALVLAKYLEKLCRNTRDFLSGKRVVELGSGLGCVGLVAAIYGADTLLTDLPKALPQLELNIRKNENLVQRRKGSAKAASLNWNEEIDLEPFDFILAADCVYYKEVVGQPRVNWCPRANDYTWLLPVETDSNCFLWQSIPEKSVLGFVKALMRLSTPSTRIFLTQENRSYSEIQTEVWHFFVDEASKHFKFRVVPPREQHEEYRTPDIYLIEFTKM